MVQAGGPKEEEQWSFYFIMGLGTEMESKIDLLSRSTPLTLKQITMSLNVFILKIIVVATNSLYY